MTSLELCLDRRKRERKAFVNVLKAVPQARMEYKPDPKSRSAGELAWLIAFEDSALLPLIEGGRSEWKEVPGPGTVAAIVATYERNAAARLSFLMALPVTLGAVMLKVPKMLAGGLDAPLVAGILTAAVVGVLSIRVLFAWVRTRSYVPFVIYRFAFSALIVIVWLARS